MQDGRVLETTHDHYIVTMRGYVVASDIIEGSDYVQRMDGKWVRVHSVERRVDRVETYNVWLDRSPFVCVNGLVATPLCRASPLMEIAPSDAMPWLTVATRYVMAS